MAKKSLKDYTPEQLWKIESRLFRIDIQKNPEIAVNIYKFLSEVKAARELALRHKEAMETRGMESYMEWSKDNPLSPRAAVHLGLIEREIVQPAVELSQRYAETQAKKARMPRSVTNEGGITMIDLIFQIAKDNPDEKPSKLWPHLKSAIEGWAETCIEKLHNPKNPLYEYLLWNGKIKTITYESFCKKLNKIR